MNEGIKKSLFILLILLFILSSTAFAECEIRDTISEGSSESYELEGITYRVGIIDKSDEGVRFMVELQTFGIAHQTPILGENENYYIDDSKIFTVKDITESSVEFCISINQPVNDIRCSDGKKNGLEMGVDCGGTCPKKCSSDDCTSDEECDDGDSSTKDRCLQSSEYNEFYEKIKKCYHVLITECKNDDGYCPSGCGYNSDNDCEEKDACKEDSDCMDNDDATKDTCEGTPKKCVFTKVTTCADGDNFCPPGCGFENDNDCPECLKNADCDDKDISTRDSCESNKCRNTEITSCEDGDGYCPANCRYEQDKDCPEPDQCSTDEECDDGDACTEDICQGTPKKCHNQKAAGCDYEGKCVPVGVRVKNSYCSEDSSLKELSTTTCKNDYECLSNKCTDNQCEEMSFFGRIYNWILSLIF